MLGVLGVQNGQRFGARHRRFEELCQPRGKRRGRNTENPWLSLRLGPPPRAQAVMAAVYET